MLGLFPETIGLAGVLASELEHEQASELAHEQASELAHEQASELEHEQASVRGLSLLSFLFPLNFYSFCLIYCLSIAFLSHFGCLSSLFLLTYYSCRLNSTSFPFSLSRNDPSDYVGWLSTLESLEPFSHDSAQQKVTAVESEKGETP
jgi:hypothetical protein